MSPGFRFESLALCIVTTIFVIGFIVIISRNYIRAAWRDRNTHH